MQESDRQRPAGSLVDQVFGVPVRPSRIALAGCLLVLSVCRLGAAKGSGEVVQGGEFRFFVIYASGQAFDPDAARHATAEP